MADRDGAGPPGAGRPAGPPWGGPRGRPTALFDQGLQPRGHVRPPGPGGRIGADGEEPGDDPFARGVRPGQLAPQPAEQARGEGPHVAPGVPGVALDHLRRGGAATSPSARRCVNRRASGRRWRPGRGRRSARWGESRWRGPARRRGGRPARRRPAGPPPRSHRRRPAPRWYGTTRPETTRWSATGARLRSRRRRAGDRCATGAPGAGPPRPGRPCAGRMAPGRPSLTATSTRSSRRQAWSDGPRRPPGSARALAVAIAAHHRGQVVGAPSTHEPAGAAPRGVSESTPVRSRLAPRSGFDLHVLLARRSRRCLLFLVEVVAGGRSGPARSPARGPNADRRREP